MAESIENVRRERKDAQRNLERVLSAAHEHAADQAALLDLGLAGDTAGGAAFEQQQFYDMLHSLLQQVIAEGQRQGALRHDDPAALAALCLELLSPRAFQHLARATDGPPDQIAQYAVRFILAGVAAR